MVQADLATTDGPGILADVISVKFGKLDILVNNAGRNAFCDIATATDAEVNKLWDDIVGVNGRGTLLLTRAVLPILSPANSRIINIGSISSRDPDPNLSIYAGTKGMIESFTRCWARDFPRRYRCTVNTVAPGPVATEKLLAAPESYSGILREKWDRTPAAARFAKQEEVAWVVAELCDEKASWVNGAYIPVTGGATLS
ncbi:Glucose 1-dehydrogenase 2 [Fusarium oxysporum f. sp. cubense race 1]|nr:Glucose 1-dehydrogenase 2 [Fusarium oxysporum f. sp. cubense race 1]